MPGSTILVTEFSLGGTDYFEIMRLLTGEIRRDFTLLHPEVLDVGELHVRDVGHRLVPGGIHRGPTIAGPDLGPGVLRPAAHGGGMFVPPEDGAEGVVVELDHVGAPHDHHGELRAQHHPNDQAQVLGDTVATETASAPAAATLAYFDSAYQQLLKGGAIK